ncbi:hypothetical protein Scep_004349 [Stephania cephalantha]|uniref:Uncharacterized protein n=1 Tax=Stephania cephalantha TaxID=152367 RepID=A0AAP0KT78_9MAGN
MAPVGYSMLTDPDLKNKQEIGAEIVATHACNKNFGCASNCEDTTFNAEAVVAQDSIVQGIDVDVVHCTTDASEVKLVTDNDPEATECSSSFGESVSDAEDGSRLSEAEVESRFCGDDGMDPNVFEGFDGVFRFRKKKLTTHWRRYVRPLMWRCRWIELKMKELRTQSLKYDKILATIGQRKHFDSDTFPYECGMKLLPYPGIGHRQRVMRRRNRKRIEETVDIPSYMSHHNLFSYYEKNGFDPDGASMDDDCGIQVIEANESDHKQLEYSDGCLLLQFRDDDALEKILWKIEKVHSRVQKLKIHMDKLLAVNTVKFSSMENFSLIVQNNQPSSSTRSMSLSPPNGDEKYLGSLFAPPLNISENEIGDMMMDSAVSSYEDVSLPDIIESTMGLLSAAEASHNQQQNGDSGQNLADDVLIHNQAAEKELQQFEKIGSLLIEKPQVSVKEEHDMVLLPTSAPNPEFVPNREINQTHEQSVLKFCLDSEFHVPKTKRKRGERKACAGTWKADKISRK